MEYFYIYHAPSLKKVGCTKDLAKRLKCQKLELGVDGTEIIDKVSVDCGIEFAGDVERAWANWFGYNPRAHYRATNQKTIAELWRDLFKCREEHRRREKDRRRLTDDECEHVLKKYGALSLMRLQAKLSDPTF